MSYQASLRPWVVYRLKEGLQHIEVARFRKRNDAEEYLKIVRRMVEAEFEIVFDPGLGDDSKPDTGDRILQQILEEAIACYPLTLLGLRRLL